MCEKSTKARQMAQTRLSRIRFAEDTCPFDRTLKKPRTRSPSRPQEPLSHRSHSHRLGVLPSGNLLLARLEGLPNIRPSGLGSFDTLPDPVLLLLLSTLDAGTLYSLAGTSRAFFAYTTHEPLWKDLYVSRAAGRLESWEGSWRYTYLRRFRVAGQGTPEDRVGQRIEHPTEGIAAPGLYSDELFQPALCANTSLLPYFTPHPSRPRCTIATHPRRQLDQQTFTELYARPSKPVLITDALENWSSWSQKLWSMDSLEQRFEGVVFRAEAFDCPFRVYREYADDCDEEDAPLYLFDSQFVEKTGGVMGDEYFPPNVFGRDLFELLGPERPDYRWLVSLISQTPNTITCYLIRGLITFFSHLDCRTGAFWFNLPQGSKRHLRLERGTPRTERMDPFPSERLSSWRLHQRR